MARDPRYSPDEIERMVHLTTTLEGLVDLIGLCFGHRWTLYANAELLGKFEERIETLDKPLEEISHIEAHELAQMARSHGINNNVQDLAELLFPDDTRKQDVWRKIIERGDKTDATKAFQDDGADFIAKQPIMSTAIEVSVKIARLNDLEAKARNDAHFVDARVFNEIDRRVKESAAYLAIAVKPGGLNGNTKELQSLFDTVKKELIDEKERALPYYQEMVELRETVQNKREAVYKDILQSVMDASPISTEEADAWVKANISFSKEAEEKLNGSAYTTDMLCKDMADIYRILGGKTGPVFFSTAGKMDGRSFANGNDTISVEGNFAKDTLYHEMGHIAEAWDNTAHTACLQFIKNRATGKPKTLRHLTGMKGYRVNEKAYPDSFISPYVGKDYEGHATEVFSMSLQSMSDPAQLERIITKDREHFNLLMGILQHKVPSIQKDIEKEAAKKEAQKDKDKAWLEALDKVALRDELFRLLLHGTRQLCLYRRGTQYALDIWAKPSEFGVRRKGDPEQWIRLAGYANTKEEWLRFAYLIIAYRKNSLPIFISGSTKDVLSALCPYIRACPKWYDDSIKLEEVV